MTQQPVKPGTHPRGPRRTVLLDSASAGTLGRAVTAPTGRWARPAGRSFGTNAGTTGVAALTIVLAGVRVVSGIVGPVFLGLGDHHRGAPVAAPPRAPRTSEPGGLPAPARHDVRAHPRHAPALVLSVAQLAALVPQYSDQMRSSFQNVVSALGSAGVGEAQIDAISSSLDPGRLFDLAMSVLNGSFGLLANVFLLVTLLFFFTFDTDSTRRGLQSLQRSFPPAGGSAEQLRAAHPELHAGRVRFRVRRGRHRRDRALRVFDVPGAFVWAALAFVTNFIPNVGFVIGVVPPAFIALLDSGPGLMVMVIVLYSVINVVIQSMIELCMVGDAVGLSATLTFLSLVFWAWIFLGPSALCWRSRSVSSSCSVLVEADEHHRWALPIIAGKADGARVPTDDAGDASPDGHQV